MLTFLPITSAAVQPNSRSAAVLNDCIIPRSSITTMASGTVSRIDFRCASRESASSVLATRRWRVRYSCSPPQLMPSPMSAKIAALTSSAGVWLGPVMRKSTSNSLSAVASRPGPKPPMPAAISTAGMNST